MNQCYEISISRLICYGLGTIIGFIVFALTTSILISFIRNKIKRWEWNRKYGEKKNRKEEERLRVIRDVLNS